jgi:prophage DNA circulation protein
MSLDKYQQASFRGVPFLVGDLDTIEGRKDVEHEFPNSDRRSIEDLGLLNGAFSIVGSVRTQDGFEARDKLRAALKQKGPGILVHPTLGSLTVSSKPYTMSERTSRIGVARFTMIFKETQDPIFPTQSAVKPSLIKAQTDDTIDGVETDFADTFEVATNSTSNYRAALGKLQDVGAKFNQIGQTTSAITSNISSFTATVTTFTDGIVSNIFAPAALASSITDMFNQFDTLAPNALGQFELAKQLFSFGSDDPAVEATTVSRQQRADNQLIINNTVSANALSLAFNNAAGIDYGNELEVFDVRQALEQEYQLLTENTNLSNNTIDLLTELRNSSRLFFDDISVTVPKIRTVSTNKIPMSILAYQYYGSTDLTEELIELNSTIDVSFVTGDVQVLTP